MIKKLLIVLLFVGFSFGQDSYLIGTWKGVTHQNLIIFDKGGKGYYSIKSDELGSVSIPISWEIRLKDRDSKGEGGILIWNFEGEGYGSDITMKNYVVNLEKGLDQDFIFHLQKSYPYNGGDILIWGDINETSETLSLTKNTLMFFVKQ